ncbi:PRC and DUF2382 domain-containing protein [Arthrobacter sp. B0490]|uniref:PRC and DUF2382 domain-containing protein n=1 Tax=Arthrobacter sp. B0490 TaxID=2058891 RepID=UPI000CE4B044|nr:PRC and DUF2382 domain-containing protein [Arthrobacter sp. B0490]
MLTMHDLDPLLGHRSAVVTDQGDKVGSIGEVFLDDATDTPTWVTVHTGLFGTKESFVPLEGATVRGGELVVAYPRDLIRHAPSTERDGHLSPEDESALFRHYGLQAPATSNDDDHAVQRPGDAPVQEGRDDGEPWMIRSEERLRVGTETYEAARVRLRKYVVTEQATLTVPLQREELLIEREPITTSGAVSEDSLFQEEIVEFVRHEEHAVVVGTETVPVERVRLGKATVTGRTTVREQVRKERIASSIDGEPMSDAGTRRSGGRTRRTTTGGTGRGRAVPAEESGRTGTNSPNPLLKGKNKRR